jgi:hypothetical protein
MGMGGGEPGECQLANSIKNRAYLSIRICKHNNKLTDLNKSIQNIQPYTKR